MFYMVQEINGQYPQTVGSGVVFDNKTDAQDYAAVQYEAQVANPLYPLTWYVVTQVEFQKVPYNITGYPSVHGTVPGACTNVVLATDGTNFTLSWDAPANLPDTTTVYDVIVMSVAEPVPGFADHVFSEYSAEVSSTSVTVPGTLLTGTGSVPQTSDGIAYGGNVSFTVSARNAYGSGPIAHSNTAAAFGPGVPMTPTHVVVTSNGTGQPATVTWDQTYPAGAGTPTSWVLIDQNGGSPVTVSASGTPSSGTATVSWITATDGFNLWAVNAAGDSIPTFSIHTS